MLPELLITAIVFIYGIVIGSFLNVLIYRIPQKENIVTTRSHCMQCGYTLRWYDLVPLFSWIILGGKCRKCKCKLSVQYPLIEALNGVLYIIIFKVYGLSIDSLIYCLMISALIALSVIDFRTYEIPIGFNIFILMLGLIRVATDLDNAPTYVIGFLAVSIFLWLLYILSGGRAIGGGDIKLMAVCGLVLGWKLIIIAFLLGCIIGAPVHLIRMKLKGVDRVLAMGPYLSAGVVIVTIFSGFFTGFFDMYIEMFRSIYTAYRG